MISLASLSVRQGGNFYLQIGNKTLNYKYVLKIFGGGGQTTCRWTSLSVVWHLSLPRSVREFLSKNNAIIQCCVRL